MSRKKGGGRKIGIEREKAGEDEKERETIDKEKERFYLYFRRDNGRKRNIYIERVREKQGQRRKEASEWERSEMM